MIAQDISVMAFAEHRWPPGLGGPSFPKQCNDGESWESRRDRLAGPISRNTLFPVAFPGFKKVNIFLLFLCSWVLTSVLRHGGGSGRQGKGNFEADNDHRQLILISLLVVNRE